MGSRVPGAGGNLIAVSLVVAWASMVAWACVPVQGNSLMGGRIRHLNDIGEQSG